MAERVFTKIEYNNRVTRGRGLLENYLARKRVEIANKLIPSELRKGRVLDIGCGTYPYFLTNTKFKEKYGVDKVVATDCIDSDSLTLLRFDMESDDRLPFDNVYFDVVTMLAAIEHIEPDRVVKVVYECFRVLKKGGVFVITTPAFLSDKVLRLFALLRLVSPEEISEHKDVYWDSKIILLLQEAGFSRGKVS